MNTAAIKPKAQSLGKPSSKKVETPVSKRRGGAAKNSLWKSIIIFLTFAGLVAYMFSPNVPDPQRSGSQGSADSGFAKSLTK